MSMSMSPLLAEGERQLCTDSAKSPGLQQALQALHWQWSWQLVLVQQYWQLSFASPPMSKHRY